MFGFNLNSMLGGGGWNRRHSGNYGTGGGYFSNGDFRADSIRARRADHWNGMDRYGGGYGWGGHHYGYGRGFDRHGLEFGLGVGAGAGLFSFLGDMFNGGGRPRGYAAYSEPRYGYGSERPPQQGEVAPPQQHRRDERGNVVEVDPRAAAMEVGRSARRAGVIPEPYHSGDYRDLTPDQRSRYQQHKRAADRSREANSWTTDVFNRGG